MKKLIALTFLLACPVFAQVSNPSIVTVSADPSGSTACSLPWRYSLASGTGWYPGSQSGGFCTWTQIISSGGGGSGTVTSVSGTANQIDVANGTTTPVISFDANALSSLGGSPSIRSLPACTGSNVPCMVYTSGLSAAVGATTVTIPSVINGVTCTTTPSSCVVRLTGIVHTTSVFIGTSPTVSISLGAYNGFGVVTSTAANLTNTSSSVSAGTTFLNDLSTHYSFVYTTTFAGTPVGGTYELMILVE